MPNKRFEKFPSSGHKNTAPGKHRDSFPIKTASWGALPGKTQPRDRSGGDRKIKTYAKSEGI